MKVHFLYDFNLPGLLPRLELSQSACGTKLIHNRTVITNSEEKVTCKNCKRSLKQ